MGGVAASGGYYISAAGDKIYAVNKDKAVALFIMGKNKLENGMKIIGGHIDSPRIDLKPHPLYIKKQI